MNNFINSYEQEVFISCGIKRGGQGEVWSIRNFGLRKVDCGLEDGTKNNHGDTEKNQRVTEKDLECLKFKVLELNLVRGPVTL